MKAICNICPHHCALNEGQRGLCMGRRCVNGKVVCDNYGKITSIALDPIEKKPLTMFHPGSMILSVGSYGCNLHCPFCQNFEISMSDSEDTLNLSPEILTDKAVELETDGNIGIAYTYNEPFISYEYVYDCAKLAHEKGLLNVMVTNGMICGEPLRDILPYIDAMNIDLKGPNQKYYDMLGGDFSTVKHTIESANKSCHVEVTTLIVTDENDSDEDIMPIIDFISAVDSDIPLHISRFFPRYKMTDRKATPVSTIYRLADIAREKLKHVYTGNC
jgi:pyruvate formate lyase activating enzyme